MTTARLPELYAASLARAREVDLDLADAYAENTVVGDPLADAAIDALAAVSPADSQRMIEAHMNEDTEGMRGSPDEVWEFFSALDRSPPFEFDPARAAKGARAFYRYSDLFFVGLVLESLITGLTEELSKSFYITGRTAGNLRRVRQNTRHIVEVTLPGGLERGGDGWKLTVRIRLVHAQLRRLLLNSDEWDVATEGVPLHMAHMSLAATGFSAANLHSVRKLGVQLTEEESAGFMHIWSYVAWLLGVPESLLFTTEAGAAQVRQVAHRFESQPGEKAIAVAHGYVSTVPELIGITGAAKQKRMLNALFRTSRALVGNELADVLDYPKQSTVGALAFVRTQRRMQLLRAKLTPGAPSHQFNNFAGMMQRSVYDDTGISYRLPDAVKDTESSDW